MRRVLIGLGLALGLAGAAGATTKYPDVHDTSLVDSQGSRVLQLTIDLNAPPKAVWDAFMDAPTVQRWAATLAIIDARQGGTMEESYNAKAKAGDPENIRHDIIAYVPGQMFVFRNTNAPSQLPGRELYKRVVSIVQVQDLGGGRTRLSITQTGYAPGPDFDKLYAFFSDDNAWEMEQLKIELERPNGKLHDLVR
jgi:uncharacterized protein YndB with AHSA1/START domain